MGTWAAKVEPSLGASAAMAKNASRGVLVDLDEVDAESFSGGTGLDGLLRVADDEAIAEGDWRVIDCRSGGDDLGAEEHA